LLKDKKEIAVIPQFSSTYRPSGQNVHLENMPYLQGLSPRGQNDPLGEINKYTKVMGISSLT